MIIIIDTLFAIIVDLIWSDLILTDSQWGSRCSLRCGPLEFYSPASSHTFWQLYTKPFADTDKIYYLVADRDILQNNHEIKKVTEDT